MRPLLEKVATYLPKGGKIVKKFNLLNGAEIGSGEISLVGNPDTSRPRRIAGSRRQGGAARTPFPPFIISSKNDPMRFSLLIPVGLLWAVNAFSLPVEVAHPVTDFLRRLQEKGLVEAGFLGTLPRDDREVRGTLREAKAREAELSRWDRRRLDAFLREFDPERRSRLGYRDSLFELRGKLEYFTGGYYRDSIPEPEAYSFGSLTPATEGLYGENVYFIASGTVGMERSANNRFKPHYNPQQGLPYNVNRDDLTNYSQSVSTFDGFRTVIGYGDTHLGLEVGQDWNEWGPGHWQHTTLGSRPHFWSADSLEPSAPGSLVGFNGTQNGFSGARRGYRYPGEGPPMPQIRLRMAGKQWEYSKLVSERMGLSKDSSAYLVAHRLQLNLGSWTFGITEMLAVGTGSLDGVLFLPGVPLKFAEHSRGDLDNSAMSGDVEWIWKGHGRIYGELFLDDFSGPPLNFWGNKFAYLVGGSWQDPLGVPAELHLEFAHVDPWVYGHHRYNTAMQNYGALLGSSLPPNSRALFTSAAFPLPHGIQGTAEWHWRQRDLQSPGSSIFDDWGFLLPQDNTKHFLRKNIETRNNLLFSLEWQWKRYVNLRGGAGTLWVNTWRGKAGESLVAPLLFSEVYLRY
jgi:hypothetical protein